MLASNPEPVAVPRYPFACLSSFLSLQVKMEEAQEAASRASEAEAQAAELAKQGKDEEASPAVAAADLWRARSLAAQVGSYLKIQTLKTQQCCPNSCFCCQSIRGTPCLPCEEVTLT